MNSRERAEKAIEPWLEYDKAFLEDTKEMLKLRIQEQIDLAVIHVLQENPHVDWQVAVKVLYDDIGDVWKMPTAHDALTWLMTEIGELADIMMRLGCGDQCDYSRNHDWEALESNLENELGDVILMICALAIALELNVGKALKGRIKHFREKYEREV